MSPLCVRWFASRKFCKLWHFQKLQSKKSLKILNCSEDDGEESVSVEFSPHSGEDNQFIDANANTLLFLFNDKVISGIVLPRR